MQGKFLFAGDIFLFFFSFAFSTRLFRSLFSFSFCDMITIQVNSKLTNSRNPTEHGFIIYNEKGTIVHDLKDGFCLIRFKQFQIKKKITVHRKTVWVFKDLEWYVHEGDFKKISVLL